MKIWYGYGSEHSSNLVMIGRFKDVNAALSAKKTIDSLIEKVNSEIEQDRIIVGANAGRFTDEMFEFLRQAEIYTIGSAELEQFAYEVNVDVKGTEVVITTDEIEVSGFMKVLIDHGARVEVFSAHDYPKLGYGRDTSNSG